jgi:hypothetical protein
MSERLPYSGTPLPTGLPGVGGSSVEVLILPGFNTVVAAQTFGPTVDAPEAVVPSPIPPEGSDPKNPTEVPVSPGTVPSDDGRSSNFCERCVPPDYTITKLPIMMAIKQDSGCVDCQGFQPGKTWAPEIAAYSDNQGIFWDGNDGIQGTSPGEKEWSIISTELNLASAVSGNIGVQLNESQLALGVGNANETFYQAGPVIKDVAGRQYQPHDLQVCVDGSTQTWKVLAYAP